MCVPSIHTTDSVLVLRIFFNYYYSIIFKFLAITIERRIIGRMFQLFFHVFAHWKCHSFLSQKEWRMKLILPISRHL